MSGFNRRSFLKNSAFAGVGLFFLPEIMRAQKATACDISVVIGSDAFNNTLKAVEQFGGISKFVPRGSKVGILINAPEWWKTPGSYTHTDVVLGILKLLNDAGAKSIQYLSEPSNELYKRSNKSKEFDSIIRQIKLCSKDYKEVEIAKGIELKKANVIRELFDCDVFINIPVNKHHAGTLMSNCLKNFMGTCNGETNHSFHFKKGAKDYYDDVELLSQCIADVNLVRKPDLCISDATEVLKTNGPFGPGELLRPQKVFAGTDPVAMDAYGSTILDNRPSDILMINMASKHKIGRMDIENLDVKEIRI